MLSIIPRPREARELPGKVFLSDKTLLSGAFSENFETISQMLPKAVDAAQNTIVFTADATIPQEGYRVICENGDIKVSASDAAGAFYAVMSLLQLAKDGDTVPAVRIFDHPRYAHRGFMLDCCRHFFGVEKIKQLLDYMGRLKMNVFHWHRTEDQGWRIEIEKYPLLTTKGTVRKSTPLDSWDYDAGTEKHDDIPYGEGLFFSKAQIREVVEYAAKRHINVLPEVDMPGHLVAAIACYPELSCTGEAVEVSDRWGVRDTIGCCGKENIYRFVKDVIDEMCELFPYPYFHIGGDEVPKDRWKVCPHCQAKIKALGLKDEEALQSHFNNEISAYLKSKGKSTLGWNEILDGDNLNDSIIPQWWISRKEDVNEKAWLAAGNRLVLSPSHHAYIPGSYHRTPLERMYDSGPKAFGIADSEGIFGMEACQWTEFLTDEKRLDTYVPLRLVAFSESCWLPEGERDYPDFEQRLEALRTYLQAWGMTVVPQEIYRGYRVEGLDFDAMTEEKRWEFFKKYPHFDFEQLQKQGII